MKTKYFVLIGVAVFILVMILNLFYVYGTDAYVTATVEEKVVKRYDNSDVYLIFTDKGVFKNDDATLRGKWDSSELQASLKVGETYRLHTNGWRVQFFSEYPNILEAE